MKVLIVLTLLLIGCSKNIYKVGDCFDNSPIAVYEILEIKDDHYIVEIRSILGTYERPLTFKFLEDEMTKDGTLPVSCDSIK